MGITAASRRPERWLENDTLCSLEGVKCSSRADVVVYVQYSLSASTKVTSFRKKHAQ
jgi:hypothetical protein